MVYYVGLYILKYIYEGDINSSQQYQFVDIISSSWRNQYKPFSQSRIFPRLVYLPITPIIVHSASVSLRCSHDCAKYANT